MTSCCIEVIHPTPARRQRHRIPWFLESNCDNHVSERRGRRGPTGPTGLEGATGPQGPTGPAGGGGSGQDRYAQAISEVKIGVTEGTIDVTFGIELYAIGITFLEDGRGLQINEPGLYNVIVSGAFDDVSAQVLRKLILTLDGEASNFYYSTVTEDTLSLETSISATWDIPLSQDQVVGLQVQVGGFEATGAISLALTYVGPLV